VLKKTPQGAISRQKAFLSGSQPLNEVKERCSQAPPPFWSHSSIAFTCAPVADSVLASGDQSKVQAVIQQLPYN